MGDLLEQLDLLTARENPTTGNPDVRDTSTGQAWPKWDRCPGCNQMGWGACFPRLDHQRRELRTIEGWLTIASCECGRLRWYGMERRDGDHWLNHTPAVWGPIVPRPDVDAWMAGADRAEVLA